MGMEDGSASRMAAIQEVKSRVPLRYEPLTNENGDVLKVSDYYGANCFNISQMSEKLPADVYEKLQTTVESGKKLDLDIANAVAHAIKEWALENGATHFCHWFQPQTGSTAEKHDAFLSFDEHSWVIERFSGAQLIQSEPDASSFPSGGMRTTFEARGYTVWDPSSPVFILENENGRTLCVPSAYISYHGEALDEKTGLLRSVEVLSEKACQLLAAIGEEEVKRVVPTLGTEQEYFLVDRAFYALRPDLVLSGRTVVGSQPARGQQLNDHYFGSINDRVLAFMNEFEHECYKLGIPTKTRHNEVAPGQYETAPIFENLSVAIDHNQLVMKLLKRVARRHGYEALLHEKPFAELNGSGKHNNWSLSTAASGADYDHQNLLDPGKTPQANLRFLLFLTAVMRGVHQHSGLLRSATASCGNDHRLGANEAPPAIISIFLGETLSHLLDQIEAKEDTDNIEEAVLKLGVNQLPEVPRDNTDRNRTSPFAFTGNKFEFRAVGSSINVSFACTVLNVAVAESLGEMTRRIETKKKAGGDINSAIFAVLREVIKETKAIRFEGNNYSDEWVKEAEKRGLPNLMNTPAALEQLTTEKARKLFSQLGVYTERELESRYNVSVDTYNLKMMIEVDCLKQIVDTMVLPAAYAYHSDLSQGMTVAKAAGVKAPQSEMLERVGSLLQLTHEKRKALGETMDKLNAIDSDAERASFIASQVTVCMSELRDQVDLLEEQVADQYWPLPKYREMLFLS